MHQMGLAEPDAAIEEQRIEAGARRLLGDPASAGIGEFVRLADHESIECEARIDRQIGPLVCPLLDPGRNRRQALNDRGNAFRQSRRRRCAGDTDIHPADCRVLRMPQRVQSLAIAAADPVAQEACRQMYRDFVAVRTGQRHLTQPVAVLDLADLALQPAANARPLNCQLRYVHDLLYHRRGHIVFHEAAPRRHELSPLRRSCSRRTESTLAAAQNGSTRRSEDRPSPMVEAQ